MKIQQKYANGQMDRLPDTLCRATGTGVQVRMGCIMYLSMCPLLKKM